jgi:hypothetical protein
MAWWHCRRLMSRGLLLFALCAGPAAPAADATQSFDDWAVGTADDNSYVYAATVNDSGEAFGEYCYFASGTCTWLFAIHTACNPNSLGNILANSDSSSVPLEIKCLAPFGKDLYTYAFTSWQTLEGNIRDASRVGFAMALEGDKFKVIRFSLKGRSSATQVVEGYFLKAVKERQDKGTKDETL